ncbi:hypothetical protein Y032_0038g3574 [Ancylostoma ceylanicum]|uniref:Uncharacterized protein n=1 Tax=Ancylostoma ceylanicum TaxID=53326 RepID=A0A016UJJ1_9BILA|nr:hypothetical protein Y032_0038g3574 [Ancylostoma ceylanicum]
MYRASCCRLGSFQLRKVSASAVLATALNTVVVIYSYTPLLIFVTAYSTLCFSIAVLSRLYRRISNRITHPRSLQEKFQDKENGRTVSVYTLISLNELISGIAVAVVYAFLKATTNEGRTTLLLGAVDLIDSYRILFINSTILVNCFLWRRAPNNARIETQKNGDQYFQQLRSSWETTQHCSIKEKVHRK